MPEPVTTIGIDYFVETEGRSFQPPDAPALANIAVGDLVDVAHDVAPSGAPARIERTWCLVTDIQQDELVVEATFNPLNPVATIARGRVLIIHKRDVLDIRKAMPRAA